ncbi:acylphosphatase [candidate division TA06 bacterium]|uniref:acylphosphatase n=1 Tax=candidate division TA06 bacterium TaxID=2250710 RepID=A0A933I924_UNCT6|nr:acylphosphatase [candidate division TA06 bacterium]
MNKKVIFHISGRVQGVGYRYFVLHRAQSLELAGYVRNLRDGRVEVVAEGDEQDLKTLIDELQQGPSGAVVSQVKTKWQESNRDFTAFEVKF